MIKYKNPVDDLKTQNGGQNPRWPTYNGNNENAISPEVVLTSFWWQIMFLLSSNSLTATKFIEPHCDTYKIPICSHFGLMYNRICYIVLCIDLETLFWFSVICFIYQNVNFNLSPYVFDVKNLFETA